MSTITEARLIWMGNKSVSVMANADVNFNKGNAVITTEKQALGMLGQDLEKSIPQQYFDEHPRRFYRNGKLKDELIYLVNYDLYEDAPIISDTSKKFVREAEYYKQKYNEVMHELEAVRRDNRIAGQPDKLKERMLKEGAHVKLQRGNYGFMAPSDYIQQGRER